MKHIVLIFVLLAAGCGTANDTEQYPKQITDEQWQQILDAAPNKIEVTDTMRHHVQFAYDMREKYETDEAFVVKFGEVWITAAGHDCDALYVWSRHMDAEMADAIHNYPDLGPAAWWQREGYRGIVYRSSDGFQRLVGGITEVKGKWSDCPTPFK